MRISSETERVSAHIARAEEAARRARPTLDPLRALVRTVLLDVLRDYREAARFPVNPDFAERTPFFVDADDVPCAVAHLIASSGGAALVEKIRATRNNARVHALADEPMLVAWLAAAGLTLDEAAAIQPAYAYAHADCLCPGGFSPEPFQWSALPADGVIDGHVVEGANGSGIRIVVDAAYGDTGPYAVGDSVEIVSIANTEGASDASGRVLVPIELSVIASADGGIPTLYGVSVSSDDGSFQCVSPRSPVASNALAVEAMMSPDCASVLGADNPTWTERMSGGSGGGCSLSSVGATSAAASDSVTLLLALVATLLARRRRRAMSRTPRDPGSLP